MVPILLIERDITHNRKPFIHLFWLTYLAFLTWNALTTWWIWIATPAGAIGAIMANTFLMCIPVMLFHSTRKRAGERIGYVSLPVYWIAFEYLHHQWELAWPWLTLGNGFAMFPQFIQWYELSGALGGSLWIWIVNLMILRLILVPPFMEGRIRMQLVLRKVVATIAALVAPIALSLLAFFTYAEKGRSIEVVVVQPNFNPYHEKFPDGDRFIPYQQQVERLINLSERLITENTALLVWPETALPGGMDMDSLEEHWQVMMMRHLLDTHPQLTIVSGIDGYKVLDKEDRTATARRTGNPNLWVDFYNTAIMLDSSTSIQHYHKSKLVPGVERMPYPQLFRLLDRFAIDMGGITGSLGMQDERTVFFDSDSRGFAPIICFESVFGAYVGAYVRNGAHAILVITNDGWWGNTAGHKQHLYFSSLRAIEMRRPVARSANTGISCFVDRRGVIHQSTEYGEPDAIRGEMLLNDRVTFYAHHGDVIGSAFLWLAAALIIYTFYLRVRKKKSTLA